jgi:hypothetical protein
MWHSCGDKYVGCYTSGHLTDPNTKFSKDESEAFENPGR